MNEAGMPLRQRINHRNGHEKFEVFHLHDRTVRVKVCQRRD